MLLSVGWGSGRGGHGSGRSAPHPSPSLGSLGIAIRGRSSRLTLGYRSTHEILTVAEAVLGGQPWNDLDGGTDTLAGYQSVLRGPRPALRGYPTWPAELRGIIDQVREWQRAGGTPASIGVAVPERRLVREVEDHLNTHGIPAARIEAARDTNPQRYERELKQARSLLFVAATRARDSLVISWHGTPSPFLPPVPPAGDA